MVKTIAKETGIVILLLIAVALVMGILFYDYIPTNKTVPAKIEEYTLPQEVESELEESMKQEEQNIVRTYYIDSSDLSVYEASNDYDKGKANPFADYSTSATNGNTVSNFNSNNTNNNISNNTSENNSQNTNQSETFFNNSGK